jgi:hypothetical protein
MIVKIDQLDEGLGRVNTRLSANEKDQDKKNDSYEARLAALEKNSRD